MHIQSETKESLLIWQINRPERRNALGIILSQELWEKTQQLRKNLKDWQDLPGDSPLPIRVLAIKAAPTAAAKAPIWIAGGDLKELSELNDFLKNSNSV
ncbi:MAG: hypothetical protein H7318_00520 [Oligoflexus sp.]|nr:hypothetical protein [Oligoflexus sp.]